MDLLKPFRPKKSKKEIKQEIRDNESKLHLQDLRTRLLVVVHRIPAYALKDNVYGYIKGVRQPKKLTRKQKHKIQDAEMLAS